MNTGDAAVLCRIWAFVDKTALFMDKTLVQRGDLTSFAVGSLMV